MTDVLNTFEGGSNGTTITTGNSGGSSGTAFNFVSTVAGGSSTYVTTAYRGALAAQFASGATAGTAFAEYSTAVASASSGALYARVRFRLPVLPADTTGTRVIVITDSVGAFVAELRVISTGAVSIRGSGGSALATFAATYVAGAWWDVGLAITTFSTTIGVIEGKRYAADGTVAQTITSSATQNTLASGGTNKCQVGQIRSIVNLTVQVDDVAWSTTAYPSTAVAPTVTYGPWAGAAADTGFSVGYQLGATSSARLVVSTSVGLTSPSYSSAVAPDGDGMVKLAVTGLTAGTTYYYGVETDGVLQAGGRGDIKTFPAAGAPATFAVAFGSCQFTVPSDSTLSTIAARTGTAGKALQLIHMGDMHYQDWAGGTTQAQVRAQHMVSLSHASMAALVAKMPINYLWDNHDWGGDTSDSTAAAGTVVAAAYRQVYPTYALPATNGRGGYASWVIGRVRFIQLDTRSYRDPQGNAEGPSKTMLGSEQKAWFKARLSDSEPVKVICGQYPWRDDGNGSGRWGSYSDEFTELSDYIDANARGQVYSIFGDRHFLAADDGTGSGTRGIPQAGGAPFQQATVAVADTWSAGSYTVTPSTLQAFGWLDITDTGTKITIDYSGITTADGTTRVSMSTVFNPVAAVALPATATLTASAVPGRVATSALAATATLTAGAQKGAAASAALPVAATLTPAASTGTAPVTAAAALAVTATLTTAGTRAVPAGAALVVTAALPVGAALGARPTTALTATAVLAPGAGALASVGCALAVAAALTAEVGGYERVTRRPYAGVTLRP